MDEMIDRQRRRWRRLELRSAVCEYTIVVSLIVGALGVGVGLCAVIAWACGI